MMGGAFFQLPIILIRQCYLGSREVGPFFQVTSQLQVIVPGHIRIEIYPGTYAPQTTKSLESENHEYSAG